MSPQAHGVSNSDAEDTQNPGGFHHIPALDGVRGLALLLVLFDHLFWSNSETGSTILNVINQIRDSAWIGVNLFFALSGFLITGILMDTLHLPHFFKNFYVRRTLRIFPLYYGVLFLLFALSRPLNLHWNGWQPYFLTYTMNLVMAKPHPILPHLNLNHFWSLCVEEQFYLFWPFLVFYLKDVRKLIQVSLLISFLALFVRVFLVLHRDRFPNPYFPYSPTYSCVDNLLIGCCLSLSLRTQLRHKLLRIAPIVLIVCFLITTAFFVANKGLNWENAFYFPTIGFTTLAIMGSAFVACALRTGSIIQRTMENSVLRFVGKYSYGLYVFHYSLDAWLTEPTRLFLRNHLHSKGLAVAGGALVVALATLLLSLLSYHLYELHFLKLKRYFAYTHRSQTAKSLRPQQTV